MSINKSDVKFYIEREHNNFLKRMTNKEINDVTKWCNKVIKKRQKIKNNIITNVNVILLEARNKINKLYHGKININFITDFDRANFSDYDDNIDYTIKMAVKSLYPNFPFFKNLNNFERKK